MNNIIVAGFKEIGVYIQKTKYRKISKNLQAFPKRKEGVFTYEKFLYDYKQFCNPNFKLPLIYFWPQIFGVEDNLKHLKKHVQAVVLPFKKILYWISHLFSVVAYSIQIISEIIKYILNVKRDLL